LPTRLQGRHGKGRGCLLPSDLSPCSQSTILPMSLRMAGRRSALVSIGPLCLQSPSRNRAIGTRLHTLSAARCDQPRNHTESRGQTALSETIGQRPFGRLLVRHASHKSTRSQQWCRQFPMDASHPSPGHWLQTPNVDARIRIPRFGTSTARQSFRCKQTDER
jgi:hypothetical protein